MRPIIRLVRRWSEIWDTRVVCPGFLSVNEKDSLISLANTFGLSPELGTTRLVVRDVDWVIKLPINIEGEGCNYNEHEKYRSGDRRLARCRLVGNVLVMEYVTHHPEPIGKLPSWCSFIDCCQVGYNRKGMLVAYDYG